MLPSVLRARLSRALRAPLRLHPPLRAPLQPHHRLPSGDDVLLLLPLDL